MFFNLSDHNSIANHFLAELRSIETQTDRMRFRRNIERLGEIMAYEISKKFVYASHLVQSPLGEAKHNLLDSPPVLLTILRAGLPFFQGFLNYFDTADCGFFGAYREEHGKTLTIKLDYLASPDIRGREVILIDPMLATGRSVVDSIRLILPRGIPAHINIVSLICAPEGIAHVRQQVSVPYSIYTCALDEKLNDQFYIVPGLGDAGDLSFGPKIH